MLNQLIPLIAQTCAAQAGGGGAGGASGMGMTNMIIMLVVMFGIIYFLMIRPQQKQQKRHREFLGQLKKGDEVVTQSGIIGRVFAVEDTVVILEVADKVRMRLLKQAVANPAASGSPKEESDQK